MEKFYIVTNEKFLKEIEDYKRNAERNRDLINKFFEENEICGSCYSMRGDGFINAPFKDSEKENINLYIDDCAENNAKFGKQLLKSRDIGGQNMRRLRKGSALLKEFQKMCIENQIIVNLRFHREGDWFKELHYSGYRVTRFSYGDKYYLRIMSDNVDSITPEQGGFEEITGSEFFKAEEKLEKERDATCLPSN